MPRFYCPTPLVTDALLELPAGAARHVQVLRLQPGDAITLFNGESTEEFDATVTRMGRSDVQVQVGEARTTAREPARRVHLAVGMPANDRMDWLVEKATELGVASIRPLMTERSVLRLSGERAEKKVAHWQSVAISACEQCGGNRVPTVHPVLTLAQWLKALPAAAGDSQRLLLSLREGSAALRTRPLTDEAVFLSGPEGGLGPAEEDLALASGFAPVSLGPRVLRAETAALAALTTLALLP
ncbi:16S rRNA (uracil(1498)-N(3))-methyltransferase [Rhodoferax saidenbachensis]|uniref:Ribosomal RNA small subunit methyltransferase E n=1 Tax=Rhodoferax saidenbachensis TaxID=1484693 RepID=A0A1P8KF44_9BURK|nr:16S rRNA (uracil(1498)-N(3))-methyltransferase [Rhodoferax saidenbachensis]APW44581.1 16S rRNA (uracil(1498)-N(3))-methyltransferase [Rhodoferax saidenbachensis]